MTIMGNMLRTAEMLRQQSALHMIKSSRVAIRLTIEEAHELRNDIRAKGRQTGSEGIVLVEITRQDAGKGYVAYEVEVPIPPEPEEGKEWFTILGIAIIVLDRPEHTGGWLVVGDGSETSSRH